MRGLIGAELLKMRKRWMPYVLFGLMLVGAAMLVWLFGYGAWQDNDPEYKASSMRTFAYPYSIPALLDSGQFWGSAVFVGILTTSTLATEHNWGTIRPALSGGVSRARYLLSKLLVLTLISTLALLVAFAVGVLLSLWATSAAGFDAPVPHPESFGVAEFALMLSRTALCILPYGLLAFALTVVSRSTALGVAGTLGYMILEAIIVASLATGGDTLRGARIFFVGHSVTALIVENQFGGLENETMAFRDVGASDQQGVWAATAVIVAQCMLFLTVSFLVFSRRDVTVSHE